MSRPDKAFVTIPIDLHRALKALAAYEGIKLQDLATELLNLALASRRKRK